jgi:hypothetical protein
MITQRRQVSRFIFISVKHLRNRALLKPRDCTLLKISLFVQGFQRTVFKGPILLLDWKCLQVISVKSLWLEPLTLDIKNILTLPLFSKDINSS